MKRVGISLTNVHQILPHKCSIKAKCCQGVVKAHVPGKQNSALALDHEDVQHCASQVNLCLEFAGALHNDVAMFTCDDMNKMNIGAMAVSSYHQIHRFFLADDACDYSDHDFL